MTEEDKMGCPHANFQILRLVVLETVSPLVRRICIAKISRIGSALATKKAQEVLSGPRV